METAYLRSAVARLAQMDKPLVVAVQGFAAGAGFSLAMLGDIVIAGHAAQFTLAYTGIGLTPDGGASWLLPRLVGLRKAQEMILMNTRLGADDALAAGLVTRVVPDAELAAEALRIAKALAAGPTRAFGRTRELLLASYGETFEGHLEREARGIVASATHRAHDLIELVNPIAVTMRELRHVAMREGRLLLVDRLQPKKGIGDDPLAIAARDIAAYLGAVRGLDPFAFDTPRRRADLAFRLQREALCFKPAVVKPRVDDEFGLALSHQRVGIDFPRLERLLASESQ